MDWYILAEKRWSLIKLHGSVDWAWRLDMPDENLDLRSEGLEAANEVFDHFAIHGFPELNNDAIELRAAPPEEELQRGRWDPDASGRQGVRYPAIAVPLGPADKLVCPASHVEAAKAALSAMDGLNLLVIGYSGLDQEVLRLFSESGNSIRALLVVNGDEEMSRTTAKRIADAFGVSEVRAQWVYPDGFSHAVETGAIQRWMREAK
jgi:hypothetical protein